MTGLEREILSQISLLNDEFHLWEKGERIVLGISGGKDSLALWRLLRHFEIQIFPVFIQLSKTADPDFSDIQDLKIIITDIDQQSHHPNQKKNPCFICSRLRRKKILEYADSLNINKICFAHHKNDVVQTLLLNMIFSREISTIQPVQNLFNGSFSIIRPLFHTDEKLIIKYAKEQHLKIYKNPCPEDALSKRAYIRHLVEEINNDHPKIDVYDNLFCSLKSIKTDFLPFKTKDYNQ